MTKSWLHVYGLYIKAWDSPYTVQLTVQPNNHWGYERHSLHLHLFKVSNDTHAHARWCLIGGGVIQYKKQGVQFLGIFTPRAHARARGFVTGRGVYLYICIFTPHTYVRARGYVIGRGVYLYICKFVYLYIWIFFGTNLLSPKILTFRCLF